MPGTASTTTRAATGWGEQDISHRFERAPLSDATRALLVQIAAADPERPLAPACARITDWEEVFRGLCRNGLLGAAWYCVTDGDLGDALPDALVRRIGQAHAVTALQTRALLQQAGEVLAAIAAAGIQTIVLKGPAVAALAYPDPALRTFGDLDLMVRERDMQRMHDLLLDCGLIAETSPAELQPKLVPQCTTYELLYVHPRNGLAIEVHFDDLLNAGLASRDIDGYWQRSTPFALGGVALRTLALEDHLLHLCAHMHYHGYVRLNWFTDIALLLRRHGDGIDWGEFVATVRKEQAKTPVYYSLLHAAALVGAQPPEHVLAAIRPGWFRRRMHAYYMPDAAVQALQPMPRPDLSFYFRPVLKRLLPDLLVMGRRRDKLRYLLRLLAPPRAWLRHYYRVEARAPLAPHYLLHPLKLAGHALREVWRARSAPGAWWNVEDIDDEPAARQAQREDPATPGTSDPQIIPRDRAVRTI